MRKVFTVVWVIAAVAALCGVGAAASAGLTGTRPSSRSADRLDVAAVAPMRVLVADRLAADVDAGVAPAVTLDASLGAALAVAAPAVRAAAKPAAPAAPVAPAASGGTRVTCAGADGVFRPVASAADCAGDSALRIERG